MIGGFIVSMDRIFYKGTDMDETLLQLGVGGIFSILIIREVLGFILKWKTKDSIQVQPAGCRCSLEIKRLEESLAKQDKGVEEVITKVRELWHWHKAEDPETGIKVWYNKTISNKVDDLIKAFKILENKL